MYGNMSDSSIAQRAAARQDQKEDSGPKLTKKTLVAFSLTLIFCVVTILVLISQVISLQNAYTSLSATLETNPHLNPEPFTNIWGKTLLLTPQALDSNTTFVDMITPTMAQYFTWSSQTGGYGTCKFSMSIKSCTGCQFALKGSINYDNLYPIHNFTITSDTIGASVNLNFVFGASSNNLGASLALIGDPSQGSVSLYASVNAACKIFGANPLNR